MRTTRITDTVADTVQRRPGRPSLKEKIDSLPADRAATLAAEAGKPLKELKLAELESLIRGVSREKGWTW